MSLHKFSVLAIVILFSCNQDEQAPDFDCATSTLKISLVQKKDLAACVSNSGELEIQATGGFEPYTFSINGQSGQTSAVFTSLSAGNYSIAVLDAKKCLATVSVEIKNFTSTLTATAVTTQNSVCLSSNGTLKVKPTGGTAPFSFRINNGTSSSDSLFSNLTHGTYSVFVRDAKNCTHTFTATVQRATTGVSWSTQIKPIIDGSCAKSGCHVAGTGRTDLTKFDVVKSNALSIKTRVLNMSMPFGSSLPADQILLIACWVDDGALDN